MAASMISEDIKGLLSIKVKSRHDSIPDQYNRIFMLKIFLVCTIVVGISSYKDDVNCIIPEAMDICNSDNDPDPSCEFISAACWIQGVYVYKEMQDRISEVAYYSMPMNIEFDGIINGTTHLCAMHPKLGVKANPNCVPMQKTFYQQYQYFTFLLAALSILYYLPYILFCRVNNDLIVLRQNLKSNKYSSSADIVAHCFSREARNRKDSCWVRPLLNLLVKVMYLCSNLISFLSIDNIMNGEFRQYGLRWISWSNLENTIMYDYMGMRDFPKPGNRLLPPFGYCEFFESARDIKITRANQFKLVCEISQHILYQYCLLVLWFCMVTGIVVSILGLIRLIIWYVNGLFRYRYPNDKYKNITFRQMEHMEYIKEKNSVMYGEILEKIKDAQIAT